MPLGWGMIIRNRKVAIKTSNAAAYIHYHLYTAWLGGTQLWKKTRGHKKCSIQHPLLPCSGAITLAQQVQGIFCAAADHSMHHQVYGLDKTSCPNPWSSYSVLHTSLCMLTVDAHSLCTQRLQAENVSEIAKKNHSTASATPSKTELLGY